jgi:hypothetical protein
MRYLVFLLLILGPIYPAEISIAPNKCRDEKHVNYKGASITERRCLPLRQGNAVLVDSGCGHSAWTNIQNCLAFNPTVGGLQFVNRHYSPTGHLNVHQADAGMTFWVHDMEIYQAEFGNARYPTSVASTDAHIGYPILDPGTGTWGHMGAQYCEGGWYSSFWASAVDLSGDIGSPRSVGVELPTGDLVFVCDEITGLLPYYTMSADLQTAVSSGNLASNSQLWGIDCNGGICYVFWYDLTDLSVWYASTTDGITWTAETEWQLVYPQPYASNVLNWPQMAVTDAGNPILVFGLYDNDDDTYPFNSKVYVSNASGATPVEVSDDTYGVWSYPTICAGGGNITVVMQCAMDTTLIDSFARHDIFCRASTDGGASWGNSVNLTEGSTNRPGLPQCAKRVDSANGNFFYFYGVSVVDFDPFYMIVFHPTGHPCTHYWYVGWHAIPTGITEHDRVHTPQPTQLEISPNPFKHLADIRYQISDIRGSVIKIFDATGRLVKSFHPAPDALRFSRRWYGDDNTGRPVPAGVYFVQLKAGELKAVKKIMKLK